MTKTGNASKKKAGAGRGQARASVNTVQTEDLSPGERRNRFARRVAIVLVFALVGTMIIPALAHLF